MPSFDADLDTLEAALNKVKQQVLEARQACSTTASNIGEIVNLDLPSKAAAIYAGRRARDNLFAGLDLFSDPAWDMLLDLFVADKRGRSISISSATIASAVPPTTALRWIQTLISNEILERVPDPDDRRRSFVRLTVKGAILVEKAVAVA